MPAYHCATCGVQFAPGEAPPARCSVCEDERQYVGWAGQRWTTREEMVASGAYRNVLQDVPDEPGLAEIGTTPKVGIGQRALLLATPAGTILWDCLTYLDQATIAAIQARGGIQAIAISHPHFYGACVDWSRAFGDTPVYIHAADRAWVMRPDPRIVLWEGASVEPLPGSGVTLVHLGGHFDGAAVLHWPGGAGGQGIVLSGDTLQVVMDRRYVSFMYSFPNIIPLPAETVEEMAARMRRYPFERLYGAFGGLNVLRGADSVERSARRYVDHLRRHQSGPHTH